MAKSNPKIVTMRVRIGENELEVTGPSDYVDEKIDEFLKLQKPVESIGSHSTALPDVGQQASTRGKQLSISEFIRKISPKTDVDRVLATGFFLENFRGEDKFTASEVTELIKESKNTPPKNSNETINKNIRKGFMMAAGDKDGKISFVLTSDGEDIINDILSAQ